MNETAFNQLIVMLAAGDGEAAQRYLMHFPRADRVPQLVREGLACRVVPEVMAVFDRLAPWLASDEADDTGERIRRSLNTAGTDGLSRAQLRDKVPGVGPERMREALDAMVTTREVVIARKKTKGRTADVFRLAEYAAGIKPANLAQDPFAFRPGPFVP